MTPDTLLASLPSTVVPLAFGITIDITKWLVALAVFVGINAVFYVIKHIVLNRLERLAARTSIAFDDVVIEAVRGIRPWVYSIVSIVIAAAIFELPDTVRIIMFGAMYAALVWQAIEIVLIVLRYVIKNFMRSQDVEDVDDAQITTTTQMIILLARIVLWTLGGLFVLSNLGIEITSLIAGLGIGGIAVAFALQGILSDLFASFSIYFDKPFRIGDFINIGEDWGTVEKIGIKSTRLRTLLGEELVVSNAELTTARVHNYKKMEERRIVSHFGITYETSPELVRQVPDIIKQSFAANDGGRLDRVHFTSFGDFALIFELVYYVESADYNEYLNIQHEFNLDLLERFASHGIEFAYPTQTIHTKMVTNTNSTPAAN